MSVRVPVSRVVSFAVRPMRPPRVCFSSEGLATGLHHWTVPAAGGISGPAPGAPGPTFAANDPCKLLATSGSLDITAFRTRRIHNIIDDGDDEGTPKASPPVSEGDGYAGRQESLTSKLPLGILRELPYAYLLNAIPLALIMVFVIPDAFSRALAARARETIAEEASIADKKSRKAK